jgi:hypothetical protein
MERGLEIALEIGSRVAASTLNNLAVTSLFAGDLPRAEQVYREGLVAAERFGDRSAARFIGANVLWVEWARGRWDVADPAADEFIRECEAGSPHTLEHNVRGARAHIRLARGDDAGAREDQERSLVLAREKGEAPGVAAALALLAAAHADAGRRDEARAYVSEIAEIISTYGVHGALLTLAPHAHDLGVADELRVAVANAPGPGKRWRAALLAALDDQPESAADVLAEMDFRSMEAYMRLRAGERRLAQGREDEAIPQLEAALRFYESVDAEAYERRAASQLAAQRDSA